MELPVGLPIEVPPGEQPDVLVAEAGEVEPGDEVIYAEGDWLLTVRPISVRTDHASGTVTLAPMRRDAHVLPCDRQVSIIRGRPAG